MVQFAAGFSVAVYFLILVALVGGSAAAYLGLRFSAAGRSLRASKHPPPPPPQLGLQIDDSPDSKESDQLVRSVGSMRRRTLRVLAVDLTVTVVLNSLETGALVSVLIYCLKPYGMSFYAAGLWGGMAAAPMGSIATLVWLAGQPWQWMLFCWLPIGLFLIVNSVFPILAGSVAFGSFVAGLVIVCRFAMGYCKALIYVRVQQKEEQKDGMFVVAVAQQVGAVSGSLVFFFLVNYSTLYK